MVVGQAAPDDRKVVLLDGPQAVWGTDILEAVAVGIGVAEGSLAAAGNLQCWGVRTVDIG